MTYKLKKSPGIWLGVVIGILIFVFCLWGINYSMGEEDQVLKILLYIPVYLFLGIFVVAAIGAFSMNYQVKENQLVIRWGLRKTIINWEDINEVIMVKGESNFFSVFGISWPGYMVGLYTAKAVGTLRMFATHPEKGFLYIKTNKGNYGLTPDKMEELARIVVQNAGKEIEIKDMNAIPLEQRGKSISRDRSYRLLYALNVIFLAIMAVYLAAFFPGSGAPRFIMLLMVMAVGLFFFNTSNAARLYQFSPTGGYALLVLGIIVTGTFLILSLADISL